MRFEDFIQKGKVKRSSPDIALVKSLIEGSERDLIFLKKVEIDEYSTRKIMCNYYDVLRSLIEAIAALEGFKVYSHEAYTYYLKEKGEDLLSTKFDRFRKIRNGISYYGKDITIEETKENILDIIQLVKLIKKKYLSDF